MELTEREKTLITYGLFVLENQCFNDEENLHHEIRDELIERGGVPDSDETRTLIKKIEKMKEIERRRKQAERDNPKHFPKSWRY